MKPELQWELTQALALTVADVQQAVAVRTAWYDTVLRLFEEFDYLALPSAQVFPFPIEQTWPTEIAGRTMDSYHRWMEVAVPGTLSGCPVISIPAGFGGDAMLPIGLQMIGRPRDDYSLLELAHRWERTAPWMAARSARSSLRQLTRQGRSGSTDARAIAAASWSIGARVRVSLLVRSTTSAATPNSAPAAKAPR